MVGWINVVDHVQRLDLELPIIHNIVIYRTLRQLYHQHSCACSQQLTDCSIMNLCLSINVSSWLAIVSAALFLGFPTTTDAFTLEEMTVRHVLVPIVMEAEASPFVQHYELEPVSDLFPPHTPFLAFSGQVHKTQVTVITGGKDQVYGTGVDNVGTVAASLATMLALSGLERQSKPVDLVMNAGTCGGFGSKGAAIGDVFLTTAVANHDRRIPIPGFDSYGVGKLEAVPSSIMAEKLGFKTGVCTTGNSLDKTDRDVELMAENDASVKDMEAAAIAYVAAMHEVPYLGVKVVTDIVDGGIPTQEEFFQNLHSAAQSLQQALPQVLEYVCAETVPDKEEL
eukprot:Nitzschia sp. Nitz4//scaffold71_size96697//19694//20804//NITZ4_004687-RA/size96697-augustus-gene-0.143-mRNA-1//1//CDS//3329557223//1036//frame0